MVMITNHITHDTGARGSATLSHIYHGPL